MTARFHLQNAEPFLRSLTKSASSIARHHAPKQDERPAWSGLDMSAALQHWLMLMGGFSNHGNALTNRAFQPTPVCAACGQESGCDDGRVQQDELLVEKVPQGHRIRTTFIGRLGWVTADKATSSSRSVAMKSRTSLAQEHRFVNGMRTSSEDSPSQPGDLRRRRKCKSP